MIRSAIAVVHSTWPYRRPKINYFEAENNDIASEIIYIYIYIYIYNHYYSLNFSLFVGKTYFPVEMSAALQFIQFGDNSPDPRRLLSCRSIFTSSAYETSDAYCYLLCTTSVITIRYGSSDRRLNRRGEWRIRVTDLRGIGQPYILSHRAAISVSRIRSDPIEYERNSAARPSHRQRL